MSLCWPAKNHEGGNMMKQPLIAALVFLALPVSARSAPICNQGNSGQLVIDAASGQPFVCDGAGGWIKPTDMPHTSNAGEWRFNPQSRLMEYFDGQQWIAVSPKTR